jgi:regulator of replication initiation timing
MDNKKTEKTSAGEKRLFIEELIKENVDLMTENIKLAYENRRLKERNGNIENFYKIFGINLIVKECTGGYRN